MKREGNKMFDDSGKSTHAELSADSYINNRSKRDYYFHLEYFFHQRTSFDKEYQETLVLRLPDKSAISRSANSSVNGSWTSVWWRARLNYLMDKVIDAYGYLPRGTYYIEEYFDQQFAGKGSFKVK